MNDLAQIKKQHQKGHLKKAIDGYREYLKKNPNDDDAHFALGELYEKTLNEPEKAKSHYEKIIYNYQDSYYFPQARKNFRRLRGDAIN